MYWLPWSECRIVPWLIGRFASANSTVEVTHSAVGRVLVFHAAIAPSYRSLITHKYNLPSPVASSVMSETQTWFGSGAEKSRCNRSGMFRSTRPGRRCRRRFLGITHDPRRTHQPPHTAPANGFAISLLQTGVHASIAQDSVPFLVQTANHHQETTIRTSSFRLSTTVAPCIVLAPRLRPTAHTGTRPKNVRAIDL